MSYIGWWEKVEGTSKKVIEVIGVEASKNKMRK